jgi:hypothetical protein
MARSTTTYCQEAKETNSRLAKVALALLLALSGIGLGAGANRIFPWVGALMSSGPSTTFCTPYGSGTLEDMGTLYGGSYSIFVSLAWAGTRTASTRPAAAIRSESGQVR